MNQPINPPLSSLDEEALLFHSSGRPGKIEVRASKPLTTQRDLAPGTRGYIFNGDAVSIRKMLTFGSTAAGLETDPNR